LGYIAPAADNCIMMEKNERIEGKKNSEGAL